MSQTTQQPSELFYIGIDFNKHYSVFCVIDAQLEALPVPQGSLVRVWVMDEARFGLHTEMRRVWISKGVRPEVRRQTRYEWDYLLWGAGGC